MSTRNPYDSEILRIRLLMVLMLLALVVLSVVLWHTQVAEGQAYRENLNRQSVRRIRLPGRRGLIVDRNGELLADNRPQYCVAIYLEELRQRGGWSNTINRVEVLLDRLTAIIGEPPAIDRDDIWAHIRRRLPLPLLAWKDLSPEAMSRWAERAGNIPGVDMYIDSKRYYPQESSACHVLGYVGRADIEPEEGEEPFHYYMPEMEGRTGVEKRWDEELQGEAGGKLVRVDVSGFRFEDLGVREPQCGQDLMLSLDMRIQALVEDALKDIAGSCVVLDPRNGDVLAIASSPGYDCNQFIGSLSQKEWSELLNNPDKPLLNRACAGGYTPGSVFKPIVAMAALEGGVTDGSTKYNCPGFFKLGRRRFNCWYRNGHGEQDLKTAIRNSCNVYFFHLGLACGAERIAHMASALGLGAKTGIETDYERPGIVPSDAWKRRERNEGWREGDTCNYSIGQGALVVTPLQMARVTAAIANGGFVYRPRLVLGLREAGRPLFSRRPPKMINNLHWDPAHVGLVQQGMHDVVMAPRGTGRLAKVPGVTVAGKTGTAEYGRKGSGNKYGWMIAYAPYEDPRYAVALVVDKAISGGVSAAPRVQRILEGIFSGTDPRKGAG